MSGDISDIPGAVGDVGLGAAAAKSVEPDTGGNGSDNHGGTGGETCLNCGTALLGAHCYNCGQKAHIHRTLRAFFHDLVHGVLHFEGKFWRTLPLLAWRPGKLMREYIDGKRARYVSPIALFLFTVFVSFALFSLSGGFGDIDPEVKGATTQELQASLNEADSQIAELNAQLVDAELSPDEKAKLREDIRSATTERDLLERLVDASRGATGDSSLFRPTVTINNETPSEGEEASETAQEQANSDAGGSGHSLEDVWDEATSNPGLTVYRLQTNAYKLSWLLIPLSLPFVWLLFPFSRKFRMYDHTVFVTYSISFMTMLVVAASLGAAWQFWPLVAAPLAYAPFHLYRSLRGTYGLSRFGALWRMVVLSAFIWVALMLFVLIMISIVTTS
ncbi:DUF3667 domain-containing protein [Pontixanthobacter aquaemixtae]|uniref:DUF3667 domain-containing protein n=1 Tax=Pontixanthobacter aquaemixtae TaxID=1958940 RepID=A0A844ZVE1_9SPHN|nr:DUF3667 domain-containing protein [Pontixanthobacter aquaemixtae]MXO91708.1 DUF3667 domain-containing protein [Pontixanthobacter aquaemixtae]